LGGSLVVVTGRMADGAVKATCGGRGIHLGWMPPSDQVEWVNSGQLWTHPGPHRGLPAYQRHLPGAKREIFSPASGPMEPDAVGLAPLPQDGDRSRVRDPPWGTNNVWGVGPLAYTRTVALLMAPKTPCDIGAVHRNMILMKVVETTSDQVRCHWATWGRRSWPAQENGAQRRQRDERQP
jgi:hypothetical protein